MQAYRYKEQAIGLHNRTTQWCCNSTTGTGSYYQQTNQCLNNQLVANFDGNNECKSLQFIHNSPVNCLSFYPSSFTISFCNRIIKNMINWKIYNSIKLPIPMTCLLQAKATTRFPLQYCGTSTQLYHAIILMLYWSALFTYEAVSKSK